MHAAKVVAASLSVFALVVGSASAADKHPYKVKGVFAETCSCYAPCGCEIVGLEMGCEGVGAVSISSGSYNGQDLSGVKAAYAGKPGDWVRLYVQTAKPEQLAAAKAFMEAVYTAWGKVEAVQEAKVDIHGEAGHYDVSVDGGKVLAFKTEPVLGADKKTAVAHSNVNNPLNHTFLQGLGQSCNYKDGDHDISIEKGRNAYFNDKMDAKGEI